MRLKKLTFCAILLLLFGSTGIYAQEGATTAGADASGSGGTISFSIGQALYANYGGPSGSISQGIQQAYTISVETGIDEAQDISLLISAYPNPTTDFLKLQVNKASAIDISNLSWQLLDLNGRLLGSGKLDDYVSNIDMSNQSPATYFVRVVRGQQELKIFKVLKN